MKKSYISLALSGVLVGMWGIENKNQEKDPCVQTGNLCANFYDKDAKDSEGKPHKDKGTYSSAQKGGNNAIYGTDWTGSISSLYAKSNDLTFTFTNVQNLIIGGNNSFSFSSADPKTPHKITLTSNNSTLNFGGEKKYSTTINAGIELNLSGFKEINIQGNLNIYGGLVANTGSIQNSGGLVLRNGASLKAQKFINKAQIDVSKNVTFEVGTLENASAIILENGTDTNGVSQIIVNTLLENQSQGKITLGKHSVLSGAVVKNQGSLSLGTSSILKSKNIENNGSIIIADGVKLYTNGIAATNNSDGNKSGILTIQGNSEIIQNSSASSSFSIAGQSIRIAKGKKLTITKDAKDTGVGDQAITLGDSAYQTKFVGYTPPTDNNTQTPSKGYSLVSFEKFSTLKSVNLALKNVYMHGTNLERIENTKMDFDGGYLFIGDGAEFIGDSTEIKGVEFASSQSSSSLTITGTDNVLQAGKQALTITGTHRIDGKGTLNIWAGDIVLGSGGQTIFESSASNQSTTLALGLNKRQVGGNIKAENLKVSGLTLQLLADEQNESKLINEALIFGGSATLEARDAKSNDLVDLMIEGSQDAPNQRGKITLENQAKVSIGGKKITIVDNDFDLASGKLTFQASDSLTLGRSNDATQLKIEGQGATLDLATPIINLGKDIDFSVESIVAGIEGVGAGFYGTQEGKITLQKSQSVSTERITNGGTSYSQLIFDVQRDENQKDDEIKRVVLSLADAMDFKASNIIFNHQQVETSGNIKLSAHNEDKAKSDFSFENTHFSATSNASLGLYAKDIVDVSLKGKGLTLENVSLSAYKLITPNDKLTTPNEKIDLVLTSEGALSSLMALGSVNISAKGIYTDRRKLLQGINTDIIIGDNSTSGQLMIKSDTPSDMFTIGGNLTLDSTNTQSTFAVELGTGISGIKKLEDRTLGLEILGGITAIHKNQADQKTPINAKSFKFGETSTLTSKYGTLILNTAQKEDLRIAKVVLEGNSTAEAKLQIGNSTFPALLLGDLHSVGKASITHADLKFQESSIIARGERIKGEEDKYNTQGGSLVITDNTKTQSDKMQGGISSITLEGASLEFKINNTIAGISLVSKKGVTPYIHSSGISKFHTKTIEGENFNLKVSDGTFTLTLIDETTADKIKTIELKSGHFIYAKPKPKQDNPNADAFHILKLQGDIISEGNSSIKVDSILQGVGENNNSSNNEITSTISSKQGVLKFDLQDGKQVSLTLKAVVLDNGGLEFYNRNKQLDRLTLSGSLKSAGDSYIDAKNIILTKDTNIVASGGVLQIRNLGASAEVASLSIGNKGILRPMMADTGSKASLRVNGAINLSAAAPYTIDSQMLNAQDKAEWDKKCSSNPNVCMLGGGVFGKIESEELVFVGTDTKGKLVNVAVEKAEKSRVEEMEESIKAENLLDDSLFALREQKSIVLIDTQKGIKKQVSGEEKNLTLDDVGVSSQYASIALKPHLDIQKDWKGDDISKRLLLDVAISKNTVAQLVESIQNPQNQQAMSQIFSNPLNVLIAESIIQSRDNALKVGMAEYIARGDYQVVSASLGRIITTLQAVTEGIYASDKILQELKMIRSTNLQNRMMRGGNPHSGKSELAHFIRSLDGVRYANDDDELLIDDEGYTPPNYGVVWANYEGATSFGQKDNASINGLSAGYDTLVGEFKEYLLGFYANYGYGTYGSNFVSNTSHNFGLGFYTRMTFGSNEVDLTLSQDVGINTSRLMQSDPSPSTYPSYVANVLKQDLKYNFYLTEIGARYGYLIKVGDEESPFYFKPFAGLSFAVAINDETQGEGVAPIAMDQAEHFKLDIAVGLEMKKYFNEGSYLYLMPVLEKSLFDDGRMINIGFAGATNVPYAQFYQVDTAVGLYAGGQGSVGENISITGGVGVKMDILSKDVLTNWNIGFKYKF